MDQRLNEFIWKHMRLEEKVYLKMVNIEQVNQFDHVKNVLS